MKNQKPIETIVAEAQFADACEMLTRNEPSPEDCEAIAGLKSSLYRRAEKARETASCIICSTPPNPRWTTA